MRDLRLQHPSKEGILDELADRFVAVLNKLSNPGPDETALTVHDFEWWAAMDTAANEPELLKLIWGNPTEAIDLVRTIEHSDPAATTQLRLVAFFVTWLVFRYHEMWNFQDELLTTVEGPPHLLESIGGSDLTACFRAEVALRKGAARGRRNTQARLQQAVADATLTAECFPTNPAFRRLRSTICLEILDYRSELSDKFISQLHSLLDNDLDAEEFGRDAGVLSGPIRALQFKKAARYSMLRGQYAEAVRLLNQAREIDIPNAGPSETLRYEGRRTSYQLLDAEIKLRQLSVDLDFTTRETIDKHIEEVAGDITEKMNEQLKDHRSQLVQVMAAILVLVALITTNTADFGSLAAKDRLSVTLAIGGLSFLLISLLGAWTDHKTYRSRVVVGLVVGLLMTAASWLLLL